MRLLSNIVQIYCILCTYSASLNLTVGPKREIVCKFSFQVRTCNCSAVPRKRVQYISMVDGDNYDHANDSLAKKNMSTCLKYL